MGKGKSKTVEHFSEMWLLDNPDLPNIVTDLQPIPLAVIDVGAGSGVALCQIAPDILKSIVIPPTGEVILPDTIAVANVVVGDKVLQKDEYTWNADTQTLTLKKPTNLPVQIIGISSDGQTVIPTPPEYIPGTGGLSLTLPPPSIKVASDRVSPELFSIFWGLPVVGVINWNRSLEQHPSGSINLMVLREGIGSVRARFKKGNEIEFASVGFSVTNYSEKLLNTNEYPGGVYEVAISLTGRWNRPKYLRNVFLNRPTTVSNGRPVLQDPDCQLGKSPEPESSKSSKVSVAQLAARNNVNLNLHSSVWDLTVPKDTPRDATVSWVSELQSRLRQNNAFVNWSSPYSVRAVGLNSTFSWSYKVAELEFQERGDWEHNDGKFGYAAEYPKTKVDGEFSAPKDNNKEDKIGFPDNEPRWKKRQIARETIVNGDPKPDIPPAGSTSITSMDLNYDSSGPTKTQEVSEMEDGMIMRRDVVTYGFMYTGKDVYDPDKKVYRGNPSHYWVKVKHETEVFSYDPKYGYLTGSQKSGWQMLRYQQENSSLPETALYAKSEDPDEKRRLKLFKWYQVPLYGASCYYLEQHLDYYYGIPSAPVISYKVCNKDGSSSIKYKQDPSFVPSFFVKQEQHHNNSYSSIPHPDNQSEAAKDKDWIPLTNPCAGEESLNRRYLKILPSANTRDDTVGGFLAELNAAKNLGDRYTEYTSQFSASGPGFKNCAEETKMNHHTGRPGIATRKPSDLEPVEPESEAPDKTEATQPGFEYYLFTPGYNINSPSNSSTSFPHAKTINDALIAARADLKVRDVQESVSFGFTIPFNYQIGEFDRVSVMTGMDSYQVRVLGISNSVQIQGTLDGYPVITAPGGTKISGGCDREIPVTIQKVAIPEPPKPSPSQDPNQVVFLNPIEMDVTLGQILPANLQSRRNA